MKQLLKLGVLFFSLLGLGSSYVQEATPERQEWSFSGITGQYDKEQLRRSLQIYEERRRACHGMKHLILRTLTRPGGPGLTAEEARSIAGDYQLPTIQDDGQIGERNGMLNDNFISPYLNNRGARYLNNGAEPVDLNYVVRARSYDRGSPQFLLDVFLPYADQGTDYVYVLLTDYLPAGFELKASRYLPGGVISMPKPLTSRKIQWSPTSRKTETEEQHARDVTTFLAWITNPALFEQKQQGNHVMGYLAIMLGLLRIARRMKRRSLIQVLRGRGLFSSPAFNRLGVQSPLCE